ncbi:tyrosine-protein phosphatase [Saccharothrix sp. ST-888]|uniref:tyrosine-protein phosphatase n=1 Tax=Saccharothrix sp. ST-888 TaxID=1427391 RepID=UPI0005EBF64E|nr:tyrosine-protein phosphatase [Saccharothrix sp. ST-888]KJK58570.1 protein tyrosine phosphatase [Saccharothrix sp. ST-888]
MIRNLAFDRLHNFRDLGGYRTEDGRTVRWGRLYRSDSLAKLTGGPDRERFLALGIHTVIDLRYPWEIEARGRVPEDLGTDYHNLSIEHRPYDQAALGPEIDTAHFLAERYAEVAEDGVKEIRQALEVIAADSAPLVFHCASGKDRTGIVAALVLDLLGVPAETVVADFALTGLATERLVADWRGAHGGREPRWPGYGQAPPELMRLFLGGLAARHGSVRGYVHEVLGLGPEFGTLLRERLLDG